MIEKKFFEICVRDKMFEYSRHIKQRNVVEKLLISNSVLKQLGGK